MEFNRESKSTDRDYYRNGNPLGILGEQKANTRCPMLFHSSPALRRIRQLARLIRRHPDLPAHSSNAPWRAPELSNGTLPDPAQFVDSSVSNDRSFRRGDANTRRKHLNRPHPSEGQ